MRQDWGDQLFARCVYELNGVKMTTDHAIGATTLGTHYEVRRKLISELRDKIAADIAAKVLVSAFEASPAAMDAISGRRA